MPDQLLKRETSIDHFSSGGPLPFLLYIGLFLFFVASALFGGVLLLNRAQHAAHTELQEQVRLKEQQLKPELLQSIFLLEDRLKSMRAHITRHIFTSHIIRLLEETTHPQVRFSSLVFAPESRKIDLSGETANYASLARQIHFFEQHPQIEKVEFGGLSVGDNNLLRFRASLIVKPALLQ